MTANDRSAASRASLSGMARGYIGTREIGLRNDEGRPIAATAAAARAAAAAAPG
jgi:hypothetical protein